MGDSWIVPVKIAIFTAKVDLLPMVASGISSHAAMPFFQLQVRLQQIFSEISARVRACLGPD